MSYTSVLWTEIPVAHACFFLSALPPVPPFHFLLFLHPSYSFFPFLFHPVFLSPSLSPFLGVCAAVALLFFVLLSARTDQDGDTSLLIASGGVHTELAKVLLEHGAKVDATTKVSGARHCAPQSKGGKEGRRKEGRTEGEGETK